MLFVLKISGQHEELKFNHFYLVVDSITFNGLKSSKLLESMINLDAGLPDFQPIDSTTSTIYLRGKNTYIEIMGPNNRFKEEVGSIGLGYSWDSSSPNDTLFESRIKSNSDLEFKNYNVSRKFDGKEVSWFSAYYSNLEGQIATWFAFYNTDFLTSLNHKSYSSFTLFSGNKVNLLYQFMCLYLNI